MNLTELSTLLAHHPDKTFQMLLPGGGEVPVAFHVTEVGHVNKQFIDCGGHYHQSNTVQLQAWVGQDTDHRLEAGKLLSILQKARQNPLPPDAGEFPVEIEYENLELTQFRIARSEISGGSVVLHLAGKHSDCLAKDRCMVPPAGKAETEAACCSGSGCCA